MTATYQELLKKAYIQRLRNQKDGNAILACLDSIYEDYLKEQQAPNVIGVGTVSSDGAISLNFN
jgi:hypothetical protein